MTRARELLAMPPEPIEILAGLGAIIWAGAWLRFVLAPHLPVGPAYADLASLPPVAQALIVCAAANGGVIMVACAYANVAPLRFAAAVVMFLFWLLVLLRVWMRVGFSPTAACYLILLSLCLTAAGMLLRSGYVRPSW